MSSRKRKNPNHDTEYPAPKRLKTSNSDDGRGADDDEEHKPESVFAFDTAKACTKMVALYPKKQRLRLQNKEQWIRIQQKQKEIELLQSRLQRIAKQYEPYHRLLVCFANSFDQMFVTLQRQIDGEHAMPLTHYAMKSLVEGVRVNPSDGDTKVHSYPFREKLEEIYCMLQSRTDSVMHFLQYVVAQLSDASAAEHKSLKQYVEHVRQQMDDYWRLCKDVRCKYEKQTLLSEHQLLLHENWDLAVHYKSLLRHYKYAMHFPRNIRREHESDAAVDSNARNGDSNNNSNTKIKLESNKHNAAADVSMKHEHDLHSMKQEQCVSDRVGNDHHDDADDNDAYQDDDRRSTARGGGGDKQKQKHKHTHNHEDDEHDGHDEAERSKTKQNQKKKKMATNDEAADGDDDGDDNTRLQTLKDDMQALREKYEKQKDEVYSLRTKLSESEKIASEYKGKYENYLRQMNECQSSAQDDECERQFTRNLSEFSVVLQEEFRGILQKQANDKEATLKQQMDVLNRRLSETKNRLFMAQVKCVKVKPSLSSTQKAKSKSTAEDKEKEKERDTGKEKEKEKIHKRGPKEKEKEKEKERESERYSSSSSRRKDRTKHKQDAEAAAEEEEEDDDSDAESPSRSRSHSRTKRNRSQSSYDQDVDKSKDSKRDKENRKNNHSNTSSRKAKSSSSSSSVDDDREHRDKDRKKEYRKRDRTEKHERSKEKDKEKAKDKDKDKDKERERERERDRGRGKPSPKHQKEKEKEKEKEKGRDREKQKRSDDDDEDAMAAVARSMEQEAEHEDTDDFDNDNINGKNATCMESVKQFLFKQLQSEIRKNTELQKTMDRIQTQGQPTATATEIDSTASTMEVDTGSHPPPPLSTDKHVVDDVHDGGDGDGEQVTAMMNKMKTQNEALKSKMAAFHKQTKKMEALTKRLEILKGEYNKCLRKELENVEVRNQDKDVWCDEITKLKEQNDFLVSSNHKNRAELKRMNEEKKLLLAKFELHEKQQQVLEKQIAEKETEMAIIKQMETSHATQMQSKQQSNTLLQEAAKKLYLQIQGIKAELQSKTEDFQEKQQRYQELDDRWKEAMEEKQKLSVKCKSLDVKMSKLESEQLQQQQQRVAENTGSGSGSGGGGGGGDGNDTDEKIKILNHMLQSKKQKLNCAVCKEREKKVLLSKCLHMFCRECIKQQKTARNRSCPLCKKKFDPNSDVKPINF